MQLVQQALLPDGVVRSSEVEQDDDCPPGRGRLVAVADKLGEPGNLFLGATPLAEAGLGGMQQVPGLGPPVESRLNQTLGQLGQGGCQGNRPLGTSSALVGSLALLEDRHDMGSSPRRGNLPLAPGCVESAAGPPGGRQCRGAAGARRRSRLVLWSSWPGGSGELCPARDAKTAFQSVRHPGCQRQLEERCCGSFCGGVLASCGLAEGG